MKTIASLTLPVATPALSTPALSTPALSTMPVEVDEPISETTVDPALPWVVLVWNDPINLMPYVSLVFQKLFGYSKEKADQLMMEVHENGRSAVATGTREKAEFDVYRLHEYGLWATMQQD